MPAVRSSSRSSPGWLMLFVVVAVITIAAVAAVLAYLAMGGELTVPFTDPPQTVSFKKKEAPKEWQPPANTVAVPLSGRDVRAYTAITRDDLWNPKLSRMAAVYMDPATLPESVIRDPKEIIGRVLAREKPAGYVFQTDDFLPKGTRPGLVAGIPAGMRAMRVDLDKVRGLFGLHPGDRFDLVATQEMKGDAAADLKRLGGVVGERIAIEASMQNQGKQAAVRVVVQNGTVVTPAQVVEVPVGVSSLTGGKGVGSRPVQEVVIAVRPEEVGPLAEALAVGAELSVVPRSGRPDDPKDSVTPDLVPKRPFDEASGGTTGTGAGLRLVETIDGSNRDIVPVPKQSGDKEPK